MQEKIKEGAKILVNVCAGLKPSESACILCDSKTREVAEAVRSECLEISSAVSLLEIPPLQVHGEKPPAGVDKQMYAANVIFCLTSMSLAHSDERKKATDNGSRFLSLPDYSLKLLAGSSLRFDFNKAILPAHDLADKLTNAKFICITTPTGTDFSFSVVERSSNCCPGVCLEDGTLGSPPDVEVNIAPIEDSANGVIYVDGSIPCDEIGIIKSDPVVITVKDGAIVDIQGNEQATALKKLLEKHSPEAKILGEFGIGLNDCAELSGCMLEDEGCKDTVHFGFGSNSTIGGKNKVCFHLDFVIKNATVFLDNAKLDL